MPTPPTLISYTETTSWTTTGSPKSIASISWQVDDVLVALAGAEGAGTETVGGISNTGTGLSWGAAKQTHSAASDCAGAVFACVATAASSGVISMTNDSGISTWGFAVWVYRGSAGIGNSVEQDTTTQTVNLTPTGVDSAMVWGVFDWSAEAVHTMTPTPTNVDEGTQGGGYTIHVGDLADQTSAGATAYGILPDGVGDTGPYTILVLEIKASAGAALDVVLKDPPNRGKQGFRDSRGLKGPGFRSFQ
jgi:hypothetical protein